MDTADAGRKGGFATAAGRTQAERSAAMSHAATVRWQRTAEARAKAKAALRAMTQKQRKDKAAARAKAKLAAESRRRNRT